MPDVNIICVLKQCKTNTYKLKYGGFNFEKHFQEHLN